QELLSLRHAEPAHSVRSAEPTRRDAGGFLNCRLRLRHFAIDKTLRFEIQARMRVGMIAQLMTASGYLAGDIRAAANVLTAHEKCRGNTIFGQSFQKFGRRFAGAVIERK